MTIVIGYRLDTNGYPTETYKGTGRNGRRKNIGTGTVIKAVVVMVIKAVVGTGIKAVVGMVIRPAEDMVIITTEGAVIRTVFGTKNGV